MAFGHYHLKNTLTFNYTLKKKRHTFYQNTYFRGEIPRSTINQSTFKQYAINRIGIVSICIILRNYKYTTYVSGKVCDKYRIISTLLYSITITQQMRTTSNVGHLVTGSISTYVCFRSIQ